MEKTNQPTIPLDQLTLIEGSYYLTETGEYICDKVDDTFTIKDDSSLEWVMEKFFNAEMDIKSADEKMEALNNAYQARRKKKVARLEWLEARFKPEVEAYAKTKLTGKTKYVDTPFGRIAWRTVKGGLKVTDKVTALSFAKLYGYSGTIKITEEFQISKLTDEQSARLIADTPKGFEVTPDAEVCSIKVASV
jgi:phage host-nuclease inhibitor protein Gam